MSTTRDVVFLIPGFLGFEQLREFTYFADRVSAVLRATLSQRLERTVEVLAVPIPATGSLAQRQLALAKTLVRRTQVIEQRVGTELSTIHLVGHSTGGVDAHLLTLERALERRDWRRFDDVDVTSLRARIRSVTSIASPHQGACFADSAIARLAASKSPARVIDRLVPALRETIPMVSRALAALPALHTRTLSSDPEASTLLRDVLGSSAGKRFLWELLTGSHELIEDLSPSRALGRYQSLGAPLDILRRSFVTIAGITPDADRDTSGAVEQHTGTAFKRNERQEPLDQAAFASPDALFLWLAELSSGRGTECSTRIEPLPGSIERVSAALSDPSKVIAASPALIPQQIDAAVNDGVVNSVRQLIDPKNPDELAAVVIADHFDVVGHYDQTIWVTDPQTGKDEQQNVLSGLLHSGSRFRDDQFFALVQRVATEIAPAFE